MIQKKTVVPSLNQGEPDAISFETRIAMGKSPNDHNGDGKTVSPLVKLSGIAFHFGQKMIFDNLNLSVAKGERLAVLGSSGMGKSTLLKLLVATLPPERGSIRIFQEEITQLDEENLNRIRMRIGMVYQYSALISSLNVRDNLGLPLHELTRKSQEEIEAIIDEKLHFVGLPETKEMMPDELSGGMQKRIAIARALVLEPELLLFDEPTAGLDPIASRVIDELIIRLNEKSGVTEIIITHEIGNAFRVATRLAMLNDGKIVEEGLPAEFRRSSVPIVTQFLSGMPAVLATMGNVSQTE